MKQTKPTGKLLTLQRLIPRGIEHTVTASYLASVTGIPRREVYALIRVLLMNYDVPIGGIRTGNSKGYFIITSEAERARALAPISSNAREILRHVDKLRDMRLKK